jgi:4-carboxymuconolactone decarboxylase
MSQLPYLRHDQLDDEARATWDSVVASRGERTIHPDGYLTGPFNALLHAPVPGLQISELGAALRWRTSLDQRVLETAVMTVAARWKAEYEWYAHARLAKAAGVTDDVIEAVAAGAEPTFVQTDERIAHVVAKELVDDGRLSEATWTEAHGLLGDQGLTELVFLCGYYTLVSFGLNAFDVPLPEGESPRWAKG